MKFLILILLFSNLYASDYSLLHEYKSRYVDDVTWNALESCFLPNNHPVKIQLDHIFSATRASSNIKTMKAAGFKIIGKKMSDKALVARHPKIPGYIIKLYLDDHFGMNDHYFLVNRLIGAAITRNAIQTYGYQKYFVVPHKWLYILPELPNPVPGSERKNFVVIAEELNIVDGEKNEYFFRKKMNAYMLEALYHMISIHGLSDAVFIKNIPFTKDGKLAFLDTERFYLWDIKYKYLTPYLNSSMQEEWHRLTGGKG
jgi:hypothetical protein